MEIFLQFGMADFIKNTVLYSFRNKVLQKLLTVGIASSKNFF